MIVTQRAFWRWLIIPRYNAVSDRNTIRMWFEKLEETTSMQTGRHGWQRYARSPENVQLVRQAVEQSARRSTWKHAVALWMKCEEDSQVTFTGSSYNLDQVLVQIESSYSTHSPTLSINALLYKLSTVL